MSTNPFDDDDDYGHAPSSKRSHRPTPTGGAGTNPFDDDNNVIADNNRRATSNRPRTASQGKMSGSTTSGSASRYSRERSKTDLQQPQQQQQQQIDPAIWAARNVEWPIPYSLSLHSYQKLNRASRQAGIALGIATANAETGGAGGGGGEDGEDDGGDNGGAGGSGGDSQNYYGFSGLMSRVLNTSGTNANASMQDDDLLHSNDKNASASSSRPIRPPRNRCVAASNGWIMAALECPSNSGNSNHNNMLRLVSRWNVRRGSSASSYGDGNLIALPPPVVTKNSSAGTGSDAIIGGTSSMMSDGGGRIAHIFVDPTGCHTLISAKNGEAYYLHSSSRTVQKLAGFGRNADGSKGSGNPSNVAASSVVALGKQNQAGMESAIQTGLTSGSYVTAVAWDRERGTEGSTKRILLGTSMGELYEYCLVSPNQSSESTSDKATTGKKKDNTEDDAPLTTDGGEALPVLLHKLYTSEAEAGEIAAVTGVHFERLSASSKKGGASARDVHSSGAGNTGMVILVATSGRKKRTRLHTFYSPGNGSLRTVLGEASSSSEMYSLVELPGSIDFADLRLCGDHFALRTALGIYFGTIDRTWVGSTKAKKGANKPSRSTATGTGVIVDAGMLPYDSNQHKSRHASSSSVIPVSISLTPHHLITLSESSEVKFINRVAQKVIQNERVDWASMSPPPSAPGSSAGVRDFGVVDESLMAIGELMMDIRRPEQVWLRKARALVHISSSCEDRDVWKFTLAKCLEMPTGRGAAPSRPRLTGVARGDMTRQPSVSSGAPAIPLLSEEEKAQEALFEHAKGLCSNTVQKAVVTAVRAEYHLSQGRAELAAKYLAQCPPSVAPFADTSIRLALPMLGIDDPKTYGNSAKAKKNLNSSNLALITYLSDKMRGAKMNDDSVVSTMIGAWLTELYLHERERSGPAVATIGSQNTAFNRTGNKGFNQAMLHNFLTSYVHDMDAKTVMRILSSHDVGAAESASFAATSGDIGTAVNAALCSGSDDVAGAMEALRILDDAPMEIAEPFYYRHASSLLNRVPQEASHSFLGRYLEGLSATKLLPSIMHYEQRRSEIVAAPKNEEEAAVEESKIESIQTGGTVEMQFDSRKTSQPSSFVEDGDASTKYLEGVIELGCRSNAIYSYLISLYAKMDDEEPLFRFLSTHVPSAGTVADANKKLLMLKDKRYRFTDDAFSSPLDMSFALRTILATGRHYRSAIKLYMGFGMRQQAVELALKVDPALARELARDSVGADERKRLWLMIARNAASEGDTRGGKDVVAKVVSVLKDCGPDVLSIEDVLPFLPDFAQIDQIKDEISDALTSYSSKIESLLKEMKEGDQTCDGLRTEINRLSSHRMQMKADARCAFTNELVLMAGEPFYVFPSGYVAVESALKDEVMPFLNDRQQSRVEEIEKSMEQLQRQIDSKEAKSEEVKSDTLLDIEELQSELDGLIAAECPLTGFRMVDSIDHGFDGCTEEDDAFAQARSWAEQPNELNSS